MKKILASLIHDVAKALRNNEYVTGLFTRYPKFFSFLDRRFSRNTPYGFSFTTGSVVGLLLFFFFMGLAQDILAKDPFVEADFRIMNLIALLRTPETAQVFLLFTHLGSGAVILAMGAGSALLSVLSGKRRPAYFLLGSIIIGQALYGIFKLLVHRTRPDEIYAWVERGGYSFPSGHTVSSTLFYGLLGFFLYRCSNDRRMKAVVIGASGLLIFLIGFSRVYLGVHWSSDVLAGWALGGAAAAVFMSFFNEKQKFDPERERNPMVSRRGIALLGLAFFVGSMVFIYRYYVTNPLHIPSVEPTRELQIETGDGKLEGFILSDNFPKYSETLVGQSMEPISFVVIGSEEELRRAFKEAGWEAADTLRAGNLVRLARAAVFNESYPDAPVTPAFLAKEPNAVAFEKATEKDTVRERHHTRYWKTSFRVGGDPVWVATASFDDGLRFFITHSIAPDVDTEREYIRDELLATGLAREIGKLQIVKPLLGANQAADPFFTDGKAYVFDLDE